jgi:hypothetical protein
MHSHTMEQKTNWQNAGMGIIGIALIGWLVITFFSTLEQALTVILTVFGTLLTISDVTATLKI